MMDEHLSKRAEREAKLKLMEETLDLRKAEMHATTAKLSKEGKNHRVRALELADLKENPCNMHKSQVQVNLYMCPSSKWCSSFLYVLPVMC